MSAAGSNSTAITPPDFILEDDPFTTPVDGDCSDDQAPLLDDAFDDEQDTFNFATLCAYGVEFYS